MPRRLALLVLALLLAAPAALAVQGANPRAQTLATTGNILEVAIASDRGHIAAVTADPGQFGTPDPSSENPLGDADVTTWFLWDRAGRLVQSGIGDHPTCDERLDGCSSDSTQVALSGDGRRMVVANQLDAPAAPLPGLDDGNRSQVHFITDTQDIVFSQTFNAPVADLAMDEDGDIIAIAFRVVGDVGESDTGTVALYRWTGGGATTLTRIFSKAVDSPVNDVAISPDGKRVAVGADRYLRFRDDSSDPAINTGVQGKATAVAVAGGKHYTAVGYSTGKVVLFSDTSPSTPELNRAPTDQAITSVDVRMNTAGNATGYIAGDAAGQLHLFRINATGSPPAILVSSQDIGSAAAQDVRFSRDGRYVVARSGANVTFAQVTSTGLKILWTHQFAAAATALAVDGKGETVAAAVANAITVFDASHDLDVTGLDSYDMQPATARNLTATFKNVGNRPEDVTLETDYPEGWAVLLDETSFSIDPGQSHAVQLRVVSGANAAPDDYTLSLRHVLAGAGSGSTNFTVEVPLVRRLFLAEDGPRSLGVAPGGATPFSFALLNEGNAEEEVRLQAAVSKAGWTATLSKTEFSVLAGDEEPLTLELQAPANAVEGDSARVTVSIAGDPTQTLVFTGTVGARFQPFLQLPPGIEVPAGSQLRFNLTVRNDGNAPDDFDVGLVGVLPAGWVLAFENGQDSFTLQDLDKAASVTTPATLRVPSGANVGEVRQLTLEARSVGNPDARAERNLLVTVERPLPEGKEDGGKDGPAPGLLLAAAALGAAALVARRRR